MRYTLTFSLSDFFFKACQLNYMIFLLKILFLFRIDEMFLSSPILLKNYLIFSNKMRLKYKVSKRRRLVSKQELSKNFITPSRRYCDYYFDLLRQIIFFLLFSLLIWISLEYFYFQTLLNLVNDLSYPIPELKIKSRNISS